MCVTTETRPLDRLGQLGEFEHLMCHNRGLDAATTESPTSPPAGGGRLVTVIASVAMATQRSSQQHTGRHVAAGVARLVTVIASAAMATQRSSCRYEKNCFCRVCDAERAVSITPCSTNCVTTNCVATNCVATNCVTTNCVATNCVATNCVTTKTRRLDRRGQLGEFEHDSNTDAEQERNTGSHRARNRAQTAHLRHELRLRPQRLVLFCAFAAQRRVEPGEVIL